MFNVYMECPTILLLLVLDLLQPQSQYHMETGVKPKETRKFVFTSVSAIGQACCHNNQQLTEKSVIEQFDRVQFTSLLQSLLVFDPLERAHPESCLQHPFITMHHLGMYTNCILWANQYAYVVSIAIA